MTGIILIGQLGIGYRELAWLAEMLTELAEKGEILRTKFSIDSLYAAYDDKLDDLIIYDDDGNVVKYKEWKETNEA